MRKIIILILILGVGTYFYFLDQSPESKELPQNNLPVEKLDFDYYPPTQSLNTLAVLLHGGSWQVGDKEQLYSVGQFLSKQGLSVINLNYRLAPAWVYDAPLQDIGAVIKMVDADPAAYQLKNNYRLVLLGFSAGGHLAAQFCLKESTYQTRQVDACISLAGIYDLDRIVNGDDGPLLTDSVKLFLGNTPPKDASPLFQVSKGEPTRFLLIRGDLDTVVSAMQIQTFAAKLKAEQVTVEEMIVPEKDHLSIFSTISQGDAVAQKILAFLNP